MKKAKITDFLKRDDADLKPVQGYVPGDLREQVIEQMKKDKKSGIVVGWNELLEAALRAYLAERQ